MNTCTQALKSRIYSQSKENHLSILNFVEPLPNNKKYLATFENLCINKIIKYYFTVTVIKSCPLPFECANDTDNYGDIIKG